MRTREPDPEANLLFGEGGAGTYSDGKLYTRRNDPRNAEILRVLADLADAPTSSPRGGRTWAPTG